MCLLIAAEYIGSTPFSKVPIETVPNPNTNEFRYLLAFARDYDERDNHTNGKFQPYWDTSALNAETIKHIKGTYPNVKVVVSIGGRGDQFPFQVDPNKADQWITNATNSLTQIILDYDLDGIDIFYESIVQPNHFAKCLGQVIENLKSAPQAISISIAPTGAHNAHYGQLYQQHADHIDWVNYQFYYHQLLTNHAFETLINENLGLYPSNKLLAGFSTNEKDKANLPAKVFSESVKHRLENTEVKSFEGIFVWNDTASLINFPVHIQTYA